jgi:YebC/PmpR family DNA-binding regulatory protein
MSGHSKWSKIKRKKGANDNKRSMIFTKLIKEITVAAKLGGMDPAGNSRLFLAIQNAKGQNMPKDNIDRAIKKGGDKDTASYQDLTYEAYGPGKVAIYIESSTDNINRTVANIRKYVTKMGGSMANNGTFEFVFDQKGIIDFRLPSGMDIDELTLDLIDAGAEDVEIEDGEVEVTTAREDFGPVQKKLKELNIELESANLERIPKIFKKLDPDEFKKAMRLIETIEEDEDVQHVYHNIEMTEELAGLYESED